MPSSPLHFASVGSLLMVPTMTPVEFSRPAGFNVPPIEPDGKLTMTLVFQPISATLRIACAANFGVPAMKSASAPELLSNDLGVHGRFGHLIGCGDDTLVELSLQER